MGDDTIQPAAATAPPSDLAESAFPPTNGEAAAPPLPAEFARDASLVTDVGGAILEGDEAAGALLGCPRAFLIGKPLGLFVAESRRRAFYDWLVRAWSAGSQDVLETRFARPRQPPRDVLVLRTPVTDTGGRLAGFRWLLRDVSAMRRVEHALWAERQLLDNVVDSTEAIILVTDRDGHVLRSNPYTHRLCGCTPGEQHGRVWWQALLPPAAQHLARPLMAEARATGFSHSGVLPLRNKAGRRIDVIWSARELPAGLPGAFVLFGYDVTELQEVQRQAVQVERLAAIGQMAAGIAHESRNALQRIQACLSILSLRSRDSPEALDLLDRAQQAQDDLSRLFEDVRSYAAALHLERAPPTCPPSGARRGPT